MVVLCYIFCLCSCLALIIWGVRKPENHLQYPFLMGIPFVFYLSWQATGLLFFDDALPQDAFGMSLFMLGLCAMCALLGYVTRTKVPARWSNKPWVTRNMLVLGAGYTVVSWYGYMALSRHLGGYLAIFSEGGGYDLVWEGQIVESMFYMSLAYPALCLFLMVYWRKRTWQRLALCLWAGCVPLAMVVFLGRRSVLATLLIVVLCTLYMVRKIVVPRGVVIALLVTVVPIIVIFAPAYRTVGSIGSERGTLGSVFSVEAVKNSMKPEGIDAMRNGVYVVGAFADGASLRWGTAFFDRLVMNFVPSRLVGVSAKRSMLLGNGMEDIDRQTTRKYPAFERRPNEFYGGFAELFHEFWLFGALFYLLLGRAFKGLWMRAREHGSAQSLFLYCMLLWPAMSSVGNSPSNSLANGLMVAIVSVPIFLLAPIANPTRRFVLKG